MFQARELYDCHTARFDHPQALTDDQIYRVAPSVFAVSAHESRSDRFRPIPTAEILNDLRGEGFFPVACRQAVARDPGKAPFTKHLIRLRRLDDGAVYRTGDTVCEVILKNANDGSAAYELLAGLFRISCLNSLVVQTGTIDTVKVRHSGQVGPKVIEGSWHVVQEAHKALAAPQEWSQIKLQREQQVAFAEAAHVLRFGDADGNVTTPIQPTQLLAPRRTSDRANDLWTVFNVTQENVVRGGLSAYGRDQNNRLRRSTTKPIRGIDQDVRLNRALFVLADRMASLSRAA